MDSFSHEGVGLALLHFNEVDYFKIYLSTIHQIERFEVQNSKKFLGDSPSPSPDPFPLLLLWLRPQFGLRLIWTPNFWSVIVPLHNLVFEQIQSTILWVRSNTRKSDMWTKLVTEKESVCVVHACVCFAFHPHSKSTMLGWWMSSGASFQLFLGGQIFLLFFNATGLLKNWKKTALYM